MQLAFQIHFFFENEFKQFITSYAFLKEKTALIGFQRGQMNEYKAPKLCNSFNPLQSSHFPH